MEEFDQIKLESFDEQRLGKPKTTARLVRISFLLFVLHGCKFHSPNSSKVQYGTIILCFGVEK